MKAPKKGKAEENFTLKFQQVVANQFAKISKRTFLLIPAEAHTAPIHT